jgi:hypothetical protein
MEQPSKTDSSSPGSTSLAILGIPCTATRGEARIRRFPSLAMTHSWHLVKRMFPASGGFWEEMLRALVDWSVHNARAYCNSWWYVEAVQRSVPHRCCHARADMSTNLSVSCWRWRRCWVVLICVPKRLERRLCCCQPLWFVPPRVVAVVFVRWMERGGGIVGGGSHRA